MEVDYELLLVAVSNGRNEDGVVGISDAEYAAELQLQEVILSSSAMARSVVLEVQEDQHGDGEEEFVVVHADQVAVAHDAETSSSARAVQATGECSCSSSLLFFCKICMEDVAPSDAHRGSHGCAHAFCTGCIAAHIAAKLEELEPAKCPEEGCDAVLDPELSQHIVPDDTFHRWCAALCRAMVLGARHVYCPFADCAEIIADERGDADQPSSAECPACRRLFCTRCGVAWHGGVSCAEYGELAAGDRGKGDLAAVETAKGAGWRRCPRCRFFVDRYEGCVHITCRCGLQFCHRCGNEWASVDHSSCNQPLPP
uniref:RBR-type E3 ubiquitin transferase n=1 Tax=Leersia perrieri TaxID=77586 RepID=A0A0D9XCG0_9ORYZ